MEQNSDFEVQNYKNLFSTAYVPCKGAFSRPETMMHVLPKRTLLVFSKIFGILWCLSTVTSRYISEFLTVSETVPLF